MCYNRWSGSQELKLKTKNISEWILLSNSTRLVSLVWLKICTMYTLLLRCSIFWSMGLLVGCLCLPVWLCDLDGWHTGARGLEWDSPNAAQLCAVLHRTHVEVPAKHPNILCPWQPWVSACQQVSQAAVVILFKISVAHFCGLPLYSSKLLTPDTGTTVRKHEAKDLRAQLVWAWTSWWC